MCLNSREVTKDDAQIVTKKFSQLLQDRISTSAVDALEIPLLKKSNRCGLRPRGMVLFGDRVFESDYFRSTHIRPRYRSDCAPSARKSRFSNTRLVAPCRAVRIIQFGGCSDVTRGLPSSESDFTLQT